MAILCTFPGKHGDSLWALPTVRAISEAAGAPVDLLMAPAYASILPLYRGQPYIRRAEAWPSWQVQQSAPMTPWSPFEETLHHQAIDLDPTAYDQIVHLGYRTWPTHPLPQYVYEIARTQYPDLPLAPLDLRRPWITPPYTLPPQDLVVGFTEEHFELKFGIYSLLNYHRNQQGLPAARSLSTTPRWRAETLWLGYDWQSAAAWIAGAGCVLACCSALHVLAVALGVPVVVVEPNPMRLHDIFWPLGQDGPEVTLVRGNDHLQTFDARHIIAAVEAVLARTRQQEPV